MERFSYYFKRCLPLAFVIALGGIATAYAVHDNGLFELDIVGGFGDGNTWDDGAVNGDDWATIYTEYTGGAASGAFAISFIEDTFANGEISGPDTPQWVTDRTPEVSFYTGGGSKDTLGIQELKGKDGQNGWKYKTVNDQVPDKNDIVNAFAAAYEGPDGDDPGTDPDTYFYFGMDTFSVNGDSNAGFWFFRNPVGLNDLEPGSDTGTFFGTHTTGDIFVAVAYTQGGDVGEIQVYEWIGDDNTGSLVIQFDSNNQDCSIVGGGDNVCGVINLTPGEDPVFDYANTLVANNPLDPASYEYESGALVEFGLNVSAILGEDIGCFSTFLAETRSSQSETAQLKDFALGEFAVCGIDAAKYCDAEFSQTALGSIDVDFNGYVENTGIVDLAVQISDNKGDISEVCLYTGAGTPSSTEVCDGSDDEAWTGSSISSGVASGSLPAGRFAIYEGSYVDSSPTFDSNTGEFVLTDTVTATATETGGNFSETEMPSAECRIPGVASVDISKNCTSAGFSIVGGVNYSNFNISGGGVNDGDVMLTNVGLTDTLLSSGNGTLQNLVIIRNPGSDDEVVTNGSFSLQSGDTFSYTATYSHTNSLDHQNRMTVTATNPYTAGTDDVSDYDDSQVCSNSPNPSINVVKNCNEVFLSTTQSPGYIVVGVAISGYVENTSTDIILTNVDVTDSEVSGFLVEDLTLLPGESQNFTGIYYPDSGTFTGGELGFGDTASASGDPAFGSSVGDTATVLPENCELCPAPGQFGYSFP